jgi:anti-sigma regulatory factor (Ser/Thr protein kinase)
MKRPLVVAVLNTDPAIAGKLELQRRKGKLDLHVFEERESFIEFINFELPELTIYNFAESGLEAFSVLDDIRADPWLHYGGVIGLCLPGEEESISGLLKGTNLVALISLSDFDRNFPRLCAILNKNRSILFQRHLQKQFLSEYAGAFVIDNDPFDMGAYVNLVVNYLFNADCLDHEGKERLTIVLHELLFNAVEHGNCAISFREKSAWLGEHKNIFDLIREKNRDPEIRYKKVGLRFTVNQEKAEFTITDQGKGFDWKKRRAPRRGRPKAVENLALHGRGITMARYFAQDLRYNKKGNHVTFQFPHTPGRANTVPGVFAEREKLVLVNNQVVFRENDESDTLYYIVSGRFDVYTEGKLISTLTHRDVFVGEMSFLTGSRRSATVKSVGKSVLLALSKKEFLQVMRTQPHYSIFLARLLAQRLQKLNRKAGRLL